MLSLNLLKFFTERYRRNTIFMNHQNHGTLPGTGFKVRDRVTFHSIYKPCSLDGSAGIITEWCPCTTSGNPNDIYVCVQFFEDQNLGTTWCRTDEIVRT